MEAPPLEIEVCNKHHLQQYMLYEQDYGWWSSSLKLYASGQIIEWLSQQAGKELLMRCALFIQFLKWPYWWLVLLTPFSSEETERLI